jgi:endonuclease YncB( thermonuclease family)
MTKLISVLLFLSLSGNSWAASPTEIMGRAYARDGDDLVVCFDLNGAAACRRVRLHGIDAFELDQFCIKGGKVWQCGVEAKQALQKLVAGQAVRCVLAQETKSYGRSVMTCYGGGLELNAEMVKLGFALDCPRYSHGRYAPIEAEAKALSSGAWEGTFVSPWAFKGKHYCEPR